MSSDRRCTARRWAAPLALAAVLVAGCGQPQGVIFEPLEEPLQWPPPPAQARIEYTGQLRTDRDLKPGRSFLQGLGAGLFGESPARSMLTPYAVADDGAGRVFVADTNAQVVHVFDLETRTYARWPAGEDPVLLGQPLGVAWDAGRERLLVADGAAGEIVVLDGEGHRTGSLGPAMKRPCGIAVDPPTGRVFVADVAAHEMLALDGEGSVLQRLGGRGTEPGQFNFPTNVAVDSRSRLYVSDSLNFRVQVFTPDLAPLRQVGSHGDLPGYFSQPKGIALDSEDHLYVVDAHFESVQIFDDEGRLLLAFGREGHGPGEFWLPAGIHIDSSDRIWIADSYNRRVQVFQYLREDAP